MNIFSCYLVVISNATVDDSDVFAHVPVSVCSEHVIHPKHEQCKQDRHFQCLWRLFENRCNVVIGRHNVGFADVYCDVTKRKQEVALVYLYLKTLTLLCLLVHINVYIRIYECALSVGLLFFTGFTYYVGVSPCYLCRVTQICLQMLCLVYNMYSFVFPWYMYDVGPLKS